MYNVLPLFASIKAYGSWWLLFNPVHTLLALIASAPAEIKPLTLKAFMPCFYVLPIKQKGVF